MRLIATLLSLTLAVVGSSTPVCAGSSSIWWPGWTINSTEDLSETNDGEKPFPHPLSALFDANPRTTWVMNPKATLEEMYPNDDNSAILFDKTKRGLLISVWQVGKNKAEKSRWISGLQIMNGDNSSQRAFAGGNRIRTLRVTLINGKTRHSYRLPLQDKMGWQRVSLPRQQVEKVAIEFAELKNPQKPVCSSGLGLLDGEREIKWNMPQAMLFWDGLEGEGAVLLLNRRGEVLDGYANDSGETEEWSDDGALVAAVNGGRGNHPYLWIADVRHGRILKKIFLHSDEMFQFQWLPQHQLQVRVLRSKPHGDWKLFHTKTLRF